MAINDLPVIVIGSGGHARVLVETLQLIGRRVLGVTDSNPRCTGKMLLGAFVEGSHDLVFEHDPRHVELVIAVGSVAVPDARRSNFIKFSSRGYKFATIIHPSSTISPTAQLAQGAQVMAGAVVQSGAIIGVNTIINTSVSLDHDCSIGAHTHVAPGATICGHARLGQICHIGAGATIIQGVEIGSRSMIAAGAVVTKDVAQGSLVQGVPAKARQGDG